MSQFKDEDQALKTLLDGDIDAVATYDDARVELKNLNLMFIKIRESFIHQIKYQMTLFRFV